MHGSLEVFLASPWSCSGYLKFRVEPSTPQLYFGRVCLTRPAAERNWGKNTGEPRYAMVRPILRHVLDLSVVVERPTAIDM